MATETLKIEISWPDTLKVPAGATVNAQLWLGTAIADYRMIIYSFLIILMMLLRPQGLFGGMKLRGKSAIT